MTWTNPTNIAAGEADSGKFNTETVGNLLHIYNSGAARAYATVLTSVGTTGTQIALAGESYDIGGNFASSTYTCPRAGLLDVRARVSVLSPSDGQRLLVTIYKNGAEITRGGDSQTGGTTLASGTVADVIEVAAGDTIRLYAQMASGTAKNTETGSALVYLTCRMVL